MTPIGPVVVIGMHRSGTSLVTRVLDDLGLFVGARYETDHEAAFFRRTNDWLFSEAGASWDHPCGMRALLDDSSARELVAKALLHRLKGPATIGFLGLGRALVGQRLLSLDHPWGWKDPRNTFTLPLWAELFPNARVVHVKRHGVDVANSLVTREARLRQRARAALRRRGRAYAWLGATPHLISSAACTSLDGAFELWERYLDAADEAQSSLALPTFTVRYEDVLDEPERYATELARFCGLSPTTQRIVEAATRVLPVRAYAYCRDENLRNFAQRHAPRILARGYDIEPGTSQQLPLRGPEGQVGDR